MDIPIPAPRTLHLKSTEPSTVNSLMVSYMRDDGSHSVLRFQTKPTYAVILTGPPMTREEVSEALSMSLMPALMIDVVMSAQVAAQRVAPATTGEG